MCSPTSLCESGTNQGCHVQGVVTCVSPVGDEINTQRINFSLLLCTGDVTPIDSIERSHVTSQSRENHTGGHFGVQLNGDLVCCMMCVQNTVQT